MLLVCAYLFPCFHILPSLYEYLNIVSVPISHSKSPIHFYLRFTSFYDSFRSRAVSGHRAWGWQPQLSQCVFSLYDRLVDHLIPSVTIGLLYLRDNWRSRSCVAVGVEVWTQFSVGMLVFSGAGNYRLLLDMNWLMNCHNLGHMLTSNGDKDHQGNMMNHLFRSPCLSVRGINGIR